MSLALDRVETESAGSDPVALATALLAQLPGQAGPVPIARIARALDIVSIELAPLVGLEGCLQCDAQKSYGQIVVRADRPLRRRRYTIAHELGHFLNERHRPTVGLGFACTGQDLMSPARSGRHQRQELEANVFAIEVLTPRSALQRYLAPPAGLRQALAIADAFHISCEAAVRRYVALQPRPLAAVFSRNHRVRYVVKGEGFPSMKVWAGDSLLGMLAPRDATRALTTLVPADPGRWLRSRNGVGLAAQTLYQGNGHAMTLLVAGTRSSE